MISWHQFLILYMLETVCTLFLARRWLKNCWKKLARVNACTAALSFFVDYPAETSQIWVFGERSRCMLMNVPLENLLFMALSANNAILLYLLFQHLARLRISQ